MMLAALTAAEGVAPESVLDSAQELTQVLVRRPEAWSTGGGPGARYVVRVTVPGAWHNPEITN